MVIDLLHLQLAFQPLSDEQDVDGGDIGDTLSDDDDDTTKPTDGDEDFEAAGFSVEEGDEPES